jgi:hypothetical protein
MFKVFQMAILLTLSVTAFAKATNAGVYYVQNNVLEERLEPSSAGKVTNKIYRSQKVEVLEVKNGWARVSRYYDGEVEGKQGKVARWVSASGLSASKPAELKQPTIQKDSRIAANALPKVGENNLTEADVMILHKGAIKFLNSGQCTNVEFGDKSVSKPNTYYINCGGPNIFFTPSDVR